MKLVMQPELQGDVDDPTAQIFEARVFFAVGISWVVASVMFYPGLGLEVVGAILFIVGSVISCRSSAGQFFGFLKKIEALGVKDLQNTSVSPCDADDGYAAAIGPGSGVGIDDGPAYRLMVPDSTDNTGEDLVDVASPAHVLQCRAEQRVYRRLVYKIRSWNCAGFFAGALVFAVGSVFFCHLPGLDQHHAEFLGVWLFIVGSCIFLMAATVELLLAKEDATTTAPLTCPRLTSAWLLPSYTDQEVTISACWIYVFGTVVFIIANGFFFPGERSVFTQGGTILFVFGSAMFVVGGAFDIVVVKRRAIRHRGLAWL